MIIEALLMIREEVCRRRKVCLEVQVLRDITPQSSGIQIF